MIEDAFTYPTARDDWIKTIIIGGILTFLGFLLIPLFIVYGYVVRSIKSSIDGDNSPPAFSDWGGLIVDGIQAFVIGIIYLLIPIIVAFVTIGGAIAAMASGTEAGAVGGMFGFFGGLTITFVLSLIFSYLAVAGIVNFAQVGRFGAAFDVDAVTTMAFNADYAIAWLVSVGVFFVAGIVAGIPFIGFIIGPFVSFYAAVVGARLWAGGYLDAVGTGA